MAETKRQSNPAEKRADPRKSKVNFVRRRSGITRSIKPTPGTGGNSRTPSEKNKR